MEKISWDAEVLERRIQRRVADYVDVLKPRETALLTFIGMTAIILGGNGYPPIKLFILASVAILLGSAGCNGLTNYLDREVDARMKRTKKRALPSERISPSKKVLPMLILLIGVGLAISWYLHPLCFLFGAIGVFISSVARKTSITHLLGALASCAPVLIGYIAITKSLDVTILLICALVFFWVPIHVWSLMITYREDYLQAGVNIFPLTIGNQKAIKLLFSLSVVLFIISLILYRVGNFSILYLSAATTLGVLMLFSNYLLIINRTKKSAWKLYKFSAYPYLGLIFLAMSVDKWIPI